MSFYSFEMGMDDGPAQLLLDGAITEDGWESLGDVNARKFARRLQACGDVDVIINSPGGDVFAGAQIYSMLKAHKGRVTVKIAGIAASIASEIAMAGDEVLISPVGYLMIHQPWMMAAGNAVAFEQAAEQLREVGQGIVNAYALKTGMDEDKIRELLDKETYMNAQSAIEMGFADGLWEVDRSAYKPAPAAAMSARAYDSKAILNRALAMLPAPTQKPQAIADLKKKRLALMAEALNMD